MKKFKLAVNILLVFIIFASIIALALVCNAAKYHWQLYNMFPEHYTIEKALCITFSIIFSSLSAIASGTILVLLNFTDFKNAIFKHNQLTEQRLAAKEQAKAERAEEAKQAKIQALEAELEELKKD